jgi:Amt family ammonium transporter
MLLFFHINLIHKGRSMKLKLLALMAALMPIAAMAEDKLDSGDSAWLMISTALVLLMTPAGLALFYGGMTRSKNVLNTYG